MKGGKKPTFVIHLGIDEWQRPTVNSEIILPISSAIWRVVRVELPTNPAGQSNTYFIEEVK